MPGFLLRCAPADSKLCLFPRGRRASEVVGVGQEGPFPSFSPWIWPAVGGKQKLVSLSDVCEIVIQFLQRHFCRIFASFAEIALRMLLHSERKTGTFRKETWNYVLQAEDSGTGRAGSGINDFMNKF